MKSVQSQALPAPPSLTGSLRAGFDATANHIELLLLPVLIDLLLWFGPHLRLDDLVARIFDELKGQVEMSAAGTSDLLQLSGEFWSLLAERLNLFSAIRSYPVGIPSLMMATQPVTSPMGTPSFWQVGSIGGAILLWIILSMVGLVLGTLYFALISQVVASEEISIRSVMKGWPWMSVQVILLALLISAIIILLSIPFSCLASVLMLSGFAVGDAALLIFGVIALWLLLPFFFSPHGIFVNRSSLLRSVRDSLWVSRATMPKTALFFLILLAIDEGLTILWRVPQENSWLAAVGIVGHAFIATGVLAASFFYYMDARRWLKRLVQQTQLSAKAL
jgi:hypothetical protein